MNSCKLGLNWLMNQLTYISWAVPLKPYYVTFYALTLQVHRVTAKCGNH